MLVRCPSTREWIRRTLYCWINSPCRPVSTLSAINRGLRDSKPARSEGYIRTNSKATEEQASQSSFNRRKGAGTTFSPRRRDAYEPRGDAAPRRDVEVAARARPKYRATTAVEPDHDAGGSPRETRFRTKAGDHDGRGSFRTTRKDRHRKFAPFNSHEQERAFTMRKYPSRDGPTANSVPLETTPEPEDHGIPEPIPYTTAASVFLYGTNTVFAALKARSRKLYKLHLHSKQFERDAAYRFSDMDRQILKLAKAAEVRTHYTHIGILNKMSEDRPHNGVVVEASRLQTSPTSSLGRYDITTGAIPLVPAKQDQQGSLNSNSYTTIPTRANAWRHPLIIMLDGILDPGNFGSILRTSYFYGVDAIAFSQNTCCNIDSATLAKASSGACEALKILSLPFPSTFARDSGKNGWKLYAAVAPPDPKMIAAGKALKSSRERYLTTSSLASALPLSKHPCILMLGAEGEGLRDNLRNKADYFVSIEGGKSLGKVADVGVDSLNVSVAAGVLLEAFLRRPNPGQKENVERELGF